MHDGLPGIDMVATAHLRDCDTRCRVAPEGLPVRSHRRPKTVGLLRARPSHSPHDAKKGATRNRRLASPDLKPLSQVCVASTSSEGTGVWTRVPRYRANSNQHC